MLCASDVLFYCAMKLRRNSVQNNRVFRPKKLSTKQAYLFVGCHTNKLDAVKAMCDIQKKP